MGCDIHIVVEQHHPELGWVGLHACPYHTGTIYGAKATTAQGSASWDLDGRNYTLFGALAGVRQDVPDYPNAEPRGLPDDASPLAAMLSEAMDDDGHSHSWMMLTEAWPIFKRYQFNDIEARIKGEVPEDECYSLSKHFGISFVGEMSDLDKFRIVFWFDN